MNAIYTRGLGLLPRSSRPAHVLADVDLEVPAGACVGLLGGNGAGKSTLLKLLLGLLPIGEGEARLFGVPVPEPESRVGVAYLPEQAAPFEYLTGREHLSLFASLEGLSGTELEERVEKALRSASLLEAADLVTSRYSKGMKQKLELERLLLQDRRLVLLDEPLTGLDIESQLALEDRLAGLREAGVTMVLTSHEPKILERLCDHFAIIRRGRLERFGTRDEILGRLGWAIEFDDASAAPAQAPDGGAFADGGRTILFEDRATAEAALAELAARGGVMRFGPRLKGVEDVIREVVAR